MKGVLRLPSVFLQGPRAPAPTNARRAKPSSALHLWVGLPGPHPGFLSFHDERNQRRAGALPLDPVGGPTEKCSTFQSHPPSDALRRSPQKREGATKGRGICHFDTVKQLAFFLLKLPWRKHRLLSNRGAGAGD